MLERLGNYTFDWKLSLFTLLLFPVMIKLGFWQLLREQEKLNLQAIYNERQAAPAIEISAVNWADDLQYLSVQLSGEFDNEHNFLLDNKINAGRVGFEVISPFRSNDGERIFINRGWVPQGKYRTDIPLVDRIEGQVELKATVYVPLGEQVLLGEDALSQSWPRLIQSLDPQYLSEQLKQAEDETLFPYSVRLLENMPGVLVRNWPVISTKPEKHKGYAVQWFLMASVLLGLYLYVSTKPELESE
jgi:cytochrome oxidase assembly protein ShyY1